MPDAIADAPIESQCLTADSPLKRSLFNSSTAQARGKAGAQARVANQIRVKQELEQAKVKLASLQPLINSTLAQAAEYPVGTDDEYRLAELMRAREGLAALWRDFHESDDPKSRKFISDSIARLSDVEFALAKRPKPGAYRPQREKPTKASPSTGPIED